MPTTGMFTGQQDDGQLSEPTEEEPQHVVGTLWLFVLEA